MVRAWFEEVLLLGSREPMTLARVEKALHKTRNGVMHAYFMLENSAAKPESDEGMGMPWGRVFLTSAYRLEVEVAWRSSRGMRERLRYYYYWSYCL